VGHTVAQKGGVAADDVHIGLTHNDVLQRLLAFSARGRAGDFMADGAAPAIGVSASETIVRGVPLNVVA
jgi:negative regulator of replication initiation